MDPAFSETSLQRISNALAAVEKTYPYFSCSVSAEDLSAGEGWGQGIDLYRSDGKYYCRHRRERSTAVEELKDEEDAVNRFIKYCTLVKGQRYPG